MAPADPGTLWNRLRRVWLERDAMPARPQPEADAAFRMLKVSRPVQPLLAPLLL